MPRPVLPTLQALAIATLLLSLSLSAQTVSQPVGPHAPKPSRYPLRVHVLASDTSYRTPTTGPEDSAACDAIDGILDAVSPSPYGPVSLTGVSSDPCSLHPEMVTGRVFDLDEDPVFSGEGRADLVSPPTSTQGFSFHYDNCGRMRVTNSFQSLPARWKQPGKKLEVIIPSDEIPANGRPLKPQRCTLTVTMHDFVYLLLRNGSIIQISQEDYWKKPVLRAFLTSNVQTVQKRPEQFTVPAHPTN
jgi:hypothetical protein